MTWVAVGVGAATAVSGVAASSKAGKQQASAQKKNIAYQQQGAAGFAPYGQSGGYANDALNEFMGYGSNETEDQIRERLRGDFTTQTGGGLKTYRGDKVIGKLTGLSSKRKKTHTYYNAADHEAAVKAELAKQKATRESEGFGAGRKNFDSSQLANDEGYQWRNKQGEQQIQRSQAARGGVFSGAAGKELARYGQGFASNEYGAANDRFNQNKMNTFNMLSSGQGAGMSAAGKQANQFNAIGDSYATAGANRAAATMGQANALSEGLSSGYNLYNQNSVAKKK